MVGQMTGRSALTLSLHCKISSAHLARMTTLSVVSSDLPIGLCDPERSLDTVVRAVSAAVLPVLVDFTSLQGLPGCAPGPSTTRRNMLVTNG